jgi:hypothetical protein
MYTKRHGYLKGLHVHYSVCEEERRTIAALETMGSNERSVQIRGIYYCHNSMLMVVRLCGDGVFEDTDDRWSYK